MEKTETVEAYLNKKTQWREALELLRAIILKTEVQETIKWGFPVYTINDKNVLGIRAFKSYFGIWFFNGALLNDPQEVLVNAQEGKTKAMRQWRFKHRNDIDEKMILKYVEEAILNQKEGREIKPDLKHIWTLPIALTTALKKDKKLYDAYYSLAVYKQKEYAAYISEAKQTPTKEKRLKKIIPMILAGIGLSDKYRK